MRNNKKKTTEQFITEARAVHGDRYDYSKTVYKGARDKVVIICPIHGDFEQIASNHLAKYGCPICKFEKRKNGVEKFISKARAIHGDKYDYSKVEYINNSTKVIIICPEHGEFKQTPGNHILRKNGCPKCAGNARFHTNEEWISRAREIHGDKYDYSLVEYKNKTSKVKIICPEHGVFEKRPDDHIHQKSGCPACSERGQSDHVYLLVDSDYKPTRMKIGITNNMRVRLWRLRHGNAHSGLQPTPFKIFKRACYKVGPGKAYEIEQLFHRYYASRNLGYTGFDGATEWFEYDAQAEKLLAEIAANMKATA